MLKKMFRARPIVSWEIIEKDVIDEIIFTTVKPRNRLILELMARGGMRVGEVLKLRSRDINGRKLTLKDPKSGKEREHVFIPQKVADRLKEYVREKEISQTKRSFPYVTRPPGQWSKKQETKLPFCSVYLIDIAIYFIIKWLGLMADNSTFRWY